MTTRCCPKKPIWRSATTGRVTKPEWLTIASKAEYATPGSRCETTSSLPIVPSRQNYPMPFSISRVAYFNTMVRDQPGEAYRALQLLADVGINLLAFTATPIGPTSPTDPFSGGCIAYGKYGEQSWPSVGWPVSCDSSTGRRQTGHPGSDP
jgi:hypothetical protein